MIDEIVTYDNWIEAFDGLFNRLKMCLFDGLVGSFVHKKDEFTFTIPISTEDDDNREVIGFNVKDFTFEQFDKIKCVTWGDKPGIVPLLFSAFDIDKNNMVCDSCGEKIEFKDLGYIMPNYTKGKTSPLLLHKGIFCLTVYVSKLPSEKELSKKHD